MSGVGCTQKPYWSRGSRFCPHLLQCTFSLPLLLTTVTCAPYILRITSNCHQGWTWWLTKTLQIFSPELSPDIIPTVSHSTGCYIMKSNTIISILGILRIFVDRVPFYIAAPTTTLDASLPSGQEIKIEERDPKELTHHLGKQVAAPGIKVLMIHLCQQKTASSHFAEC